MKCHHITRDQDTTPGNLRTIIRPQGSPESFKRAIMRYRPDPLRLLFIAEAPPAYKANRLFYFPDVQTGDALFIEMMKVIYGAAIGFTEGEGFSKPWSAKDVRNANLSFCKDSWRTAISLSTQASGQCPMMPVLPSNSRFFGWLFQGSRSG